MNDSHADRGKRIEASTSPSSACTHGSHLVYAGATVLSAKSDESTSTGTIDFRTELSR